jgi:hypothetical protein
VTALAQSREKLSRKRRNRDSFGPINRKAVKKKAGIVTGSGPINGKAVKKVLLFLKSG